MCMCRARTGPARSASAARGERCASVSTLLHASVGTCPCFTHTTFVQRLRDPIETCDMCLRTLSFRVPPCTHGPNPRRDHPRISAARAAYARSAMRPAATKTRAIGDDSPAAHLENESGGGASQERSPIPAMLQRPRSGRRPAPARSVPAGTSPPAERAQRLHGRRVGGSGCASGSRRSAGAPRVATAAAPSACIDRARLQGRVRG